MIVEFFGPPGSATTDFALRLADRLRQGGHSVSLRLSARPAEKSPRGATPERDAANAARTPISPAYELIVSVTPRPEEIGAANALSQTLPRGQIFRSLRMRQYLVRLSNAWAQASRNRNIWIFDQAYIQAVASIVMVQPPMTDDAITALLEASPHCDLAIRVNAPELDGESQLGRRRRQADGELLLEENGSDAKPHAVLAERIDTLLRRRERAVLSLCSPDGGSPDDMEVAERTIVAMLRVAYARTS